MMAEAIRQVEAQTQNVQVDVRTVYDEEMKATRDFKLLSSSSSLREPLPEAQRMAPAAENRGRGNNPPRDLPSDLSGPNDKPNDSDDYQTYFNKVRQLLRFDSVANRFTARVITDQEMMRWNIAKLIQMNHSSTRIVKHQRKTVCVMSSTTRIMTLNFSHVLHVLHVLHEATSVG